MKVLLRVNPIKLIARLTFFAVVSLATVNQSFAALSLFNNNIASKVIGNCYMRADENIILNTVTYNEVCNPRIEQVLISEPKAATIPAVRPTYYANTNGYSNNNNSYAGYYTGNNTTRGNYSSFSLSNYLLSSFMGSYSPYNYGYANTINTYYPSTNYSYYYPKSRTQNYYNSLKNYDYYYEDDYEYDYDYNYGYNDYTFDFGGSSGGGQGCGSCYLD